METSKTAEEFLKVKLDPKIAILNNPDYTFNKVIEAMEEYAKYKLEASEKIVEELEEENKLLIQVTIQELRNKIQEQQKEIERLKNLFTECYDLGKENGEYHWNDTEIQPDSFELWNIKNNIL